LGEALGLQVVSLDAELIKKAGKPIPEVVAERGWPGFRDLEEEIVRTFAARDGQVIDCGGGVIEREGNFGPLRAAGPVIWLKACPATIVQRIGGDDQRPSLTGTKSFTEEVVDVLRRREPLYQQIAHHPIDTDTLSAQQVADAICALLR
jgi:shikimate kinase